MLTSLRLTNKISPDWIIDNHIVRRKSGLMSGGQVSLVYEALGPPAVVT